MHTKIQGGGFGDNEEDKNRKIRLSEQSRISDRNVHVFKCEKLVHPTNT